MPICPSCASEVQEGSRFCPNCGAAVGSSADLQTRTSAPSLPSSSVTSPEGRFTAGTILAERYRIVGLLGRGGMGEVYRADDLKLDQQVALKFLPEALEQDPGRLTRFHGEVRLARQIAHPNVCRVYDIGEADGRHFISMEYVDGEDLASLLGRIGRLPKDKAAEVARQICAGLAAAHDLKILHRDLKPANVMIDGRGRARIADFGLAGLAETIVGADLGAGTPGYMAPEQIAGKEVTVKSDLYALGHVLYELFTGKRVFKASTLGELRKLQTETTPTSPSSHVEGLDPGVQRVILLCLEKDPSHRPESALAVAARLPGGDPLAAALAAGETPSPELVAGAGEAGALMPARAGLLLGLILAGLLASAFVSGRTNLLALVPLPKPPGALADRARDIVSQLGYAEPPADTSVRIWSDGPRLRHIERNDESPDRWSGLSTARPSAIGFEYRQSPRPMVPQNEAGRVFWRDPQFLTSGMVSLDLDSSGRLWQFMAVPPHVDETEPPYPDPDWPGLLALAGLDEETLETTKPTWLPETYCDQRAAWLGTYPDQPKPEIRVEACAFHGKPVFFSIVHPWDRPWRQQEFQQTTGERVADVIGGVVVMLILAGAAVLAYRNVRLGRADARGAFRLAAFLFGVQMIAWLCQASHVPSLQGEMALFFRQLGASLRGASFAWLAYLALEPFVRRRWPESMISWTRVLGGRLRDPRVGRDLLIGAAVGLAMTFTQFMFRSIPVWLGWAPDRPLSTDLDTLLGARWVVGEFLLGLHEMIAAPLAILFFIVLLRVLLRRDWLAAPAFVLLLATMGGLNSPHPIIGVAGGAVFASMVYTLLVRFGLVAATMAVFFDTLDTKLPMTLDFGTWYADGAIASLLLAAGVAAYGFHVSLGGRKILSDDLGDDEPDQRK